MRADRLLPALLVGVMLAGCVQPSAPTATSPTGTPSAPPAASPPSPGPTSRPSAAAPTAASTALAASPTGAGTAPVATPWSGCLNGWASPQPGQPAYSAGLEILEGYMGVQGLAVEQMRYFIGPDPPWILEPRYESVEHWYIKATLPSDPTFRGRFFVEKRTATVLGVAAAAPYDSSGWQAGDWTGFVGEGPPRKYEGLPGAWSGIPYDFVTGEGDTGQPGLPEELVECLIDT